MDRSEVVGRSVVEILGEWRIAITPHDTSAAPSLQTVEHLVGSSIAEASDSFGRTMPSVEVSARWNAQSI
jgi:hypothetical protein